MIGVESLSKITAWHLPNKHGRKSIRGLLPRDVTIKLSPIRIAFILVVAALALSGCSNADEPFPTGAFEWKTSKYYEFFEDGTWTWGKEEDKPILRGQYSVDGNTVKFYSESMFDGSAGGCGDNEGTYSWVYLDKVLSFEKVDDTCSPRISDNDGKDYALVEE